MLISDCKYNLRVKLNVICYIVRYIQLSTDTSYDKIKHLVEIAANLPDKQAINEFIAFRKKYINFPLDKQIADLKRHYLLLSFIFYLQL